MSDRVLMPNRLASLPVEILNLITDNLPDCSVLALLLSSTDLSRLMTTTIAVRRRNFFTNLHTTYNPVWRWSDYSQHPLGLLYHILGTPGISDAVRTISVGPGICQWNWQPLARLLPYAESDRVQDYCGALFESPASLVYTHQSLFNILLLTCHNLRELTLETSWAVMNRERFPPTTVIDRSRSIPNVCQDFLIPRIERLTLGKPKFDYPKNAEVEVEYLPADPVAELLYLFPHLRYLHAHGINSPQAYGVLEDTGGLFDLEIIELSMCVLFPWTLINLTNFSPNLQYLKCQVVHPGKRLTAQAANNEFLTGLRQELVEVELDQQYQISLVQRSIIYSRSAGTDCSFEPGETMTILIEPRDTTLHSTLSGMP